MPECRNCSSHVTVQFARVFGDNDGTVYRCLECSTRAGANEGAKSDYGDAESVSINW